MAVRREQLHFGFHHRVFAALLLVDIVNDQDAAAIHGHSTLHIKVIHRWGE